MKSVRAVLLVVCLLIPGIAAAVDQEPTAEMRERADQLIELTGAMRMGKEASNAMSAPFLMSLRAAHPEIPREVLDVLPAEVDSVLERHMPELKAMSVDLYVRHFTLEEINQLIDFYSTPVGRKMVSLGPEFMKEGMESAMKWGMMLGPEIQRRIEARLKKSNIDL